MTLYTRKGIYRAIGMVLRMQSQEGLQIGSNWIFLNFQFKRWEYLPELAIA